MSKKLPLLILLMMFTGLGYAQADFSGVEIRSVQVADNMHVLFGAGGNIGLLDGDDGPLMVDAQFAPLTERIVAALAEIAAEPVRYLINTHWHWDHTEGNENFARLGAVILAHDNVRVRLAREVNLPLFNMHTQPSPAIALPAITYADETTMYWNDETIRIIHAPSAHTDTDSIVHFENANVIHMGDTLWTIGFPRVDSQFGGGSVEGVIGIAETAIAMGNEDTQYIPGHGELPPRGTSFLVEYIAMLQDVEQRIGAMIESGMSEEAIVAAQPTLEYDERWGEGFIPPDLFVRSVYYSLVD